MAMGMINIEDQHFTCMAADYLGDLSRGGVPEERLVKRRRRDTYVSVLYKGQQIEQLISQNSSAATPVKRSSKFRGVSRHKWTGRYEAHLWDRLSWNITHNRKGKQVYLGSYDDEEAAARVYDLAALKYWGTSTFTNFQIHDYKQELEIMQTVTKEEYLASLRRRRSGFSRGVSKNRGDARHNHNGRCEVMIGNVFGNKYLNPFTYGTQDEAPRANDIATTEYKRINSVTNFGFVTYIPQSKSDGLYTSFPIKENKPIIHSDPTLLSFNSGKILRIPCLQTKALRENDLTNEKSYGKKIPMSSPKKPSSPTALDLLLKSSIFRELVQKNSNSSVDDSYDENAMNVQHASHNYGFYDIPIWGMMPIC